MPSFKGKHIVEEINGVRCSIVETDSSKERLEFLTKFLEKNNYKVFSIAEEENKFKIGVNDVLFNPVIAVYERRLKTMEGKVATHEYWFQLPEVNTDR